MMKKELKQEIKQLKKKVEKLEAELEGLEDEKKNTPLDINACNCNEDRGGIVRCPDCGGRGVQPLDPVSDAFCTRCDGVGFFRVSDIVEAIEKTF